jgi:hypothetical protein
MRRGTAVAALAMLALAGCTAAPQATLPSAAAQAGYDPLPAAIRGAADAFAYPETLANRPREAAIAVAQLEYLATEMMLPRRNLDFSGIVAPALQAARYEVRGWLGVPQSVPPQAVIDALTANPPQLSQPALFTAGPDETLRRLSAMPRLPQANTATAAARQELEFGLPDVDIR